MRRWRRFPCMVSPFNYLGLFFTCSYKQNDLRHCKKVKETNHDNGLANEGGIVEYFGRVADRACEIRSWGRRAYIVAILSALRSLSTKVNFINKIMLRQDVEAKPKNQTTDLRVVSSMFFLWLALISRWVNSLAR